VVVVLPDPGVVVAVDGDVVVRDAGSVDVLVDAVVFVVLVARPVVEVVDTP